jgi:hypothetical protein
MLGQQHGVAISAREIAPHDEITPMVVLGCRHCGFSMRPRAAFLLMEHCPRCLARRRAVERLVEVQSGPVALGREGPSASSGS